MVENVYIQSPTGGSYTIRVKAHQVSQDQVPAEPGVEQDFSLVWSTSSLDVTPMPEPHSDILLLAGGLLLAFLVRARRREV